MPDFTLTDMKGTRLKPGTVIDPSFWGKDDTARMMNVIRGGIIARTRDGVDRRGREFRPLSERYAREKGDSTPDLHRTGTMLDSLAAKVNKLSGRLTPTVRYGFVHAFGSKRMPRRDWMGFDAGLSASVYDTALAITNEKIDQGAIKVRKLRPSFKGLGRTRGALQ